MSSIAKLVFIGSLLIFTILSCQPSDQNNTSVPSLSAEVKSHLNRPTIFINNQPQTPMLYALPDVPGGRWSWEELQQHNITNFCEQGVKLYQLDLFLEHIWPAEGQFDISLAQKQVRGIQEACPGSGVFFRFHVNAPKWWIDQHLEESTKYEEGPASPEVSVGLVRILEADPRNPIRNSLASKVWLEEAAQKLERFCREFSLTEEGKSLVGIQPACGVYGEWHYWGFMNYTADFSVPMRDHFQAWLEKKYITEDALRQSWRDPEVSLATAKVPTKAERQLLRAGIFRDPVQDRKVIDYFQCQHELIADDIIHFCKVIKENWPRSIITGTFYGYFFSVFNKQASGGHLALHKVLKSEYVDYLSGPQVYYPEDGYKDGEPYRSRSLITTIRLNNKLWLDEYDQQPRRTWPWLAEHKNMKNYKAITQSNIAQIRRNMLFTFTKGQGLWLYDFGNASMHLHPNNEVNKQAGTNGYWDNPIYMKTIGEIKKLVDQQLNENYQSAADVLLVYDTESILYMKSEKPDQCPITEHVINWTNLGLYYAGVAFDPVHLDDLNSMNLDAYKVVIFANTFLLTEEEKAILKNKVMANNRHIIWVYAPGFSNDKSVSIDQVSKLTGFQLRSTSPDTIPYIEIFPSFGNFPAQAAQGSYDPQLAIADPQAEILGSYLTTGIPAFGRKDMNSWTSWYIGVPPTNGDLLRKIMVEAGVHIYTSTGDIVYEGSGMVVVHTKDGGVKTIVLKNGKPVSIDLPEGPQTIVLDSQSGELLLK